MSVVDQALASAREDMRDAFGSDAEGLLERIDALGLVVIPKLLLTRHPDEGAARLENVHLHLPLNWHVFDDVTFTVGDEERHFKATLQAAGALREAALMQQVNGDRIALLVDEDDGLILHAEVSAR